MSTPTAPIAPPEEPQAPAADPEPAPDILGELEPEPTAEPGEPEGAEPEGEPSDPLARVLEELAETRRELQEMRQERQQVTETPEQVEERIREAENQRQERERQTKADQREVEVSLRAELIAGGVPPDLIDPTVLRQASESVINKRYGQIVANEITGPVSEALRWVRKAAETNQYSHPISGKAKVYAGQFADDFNAIFGKLQEQAKSTADLKGMKSDDLIPRLSAEQIKAIHAHESARLGSLNRNGQKPLKRPEGQPTRSGPLTIEEAQTLSIDELKRRTRG